MTKAGKENPNWRGGRSITSHGYILIRVGKNHHLADCRGYAYEHRLVAEGKLGRRLRPGEIIHHLSDDRTDNRPENLQVVNGNAGHFAYHRERQDLRLPGEANPIIECKCGCGDILEKFDKSNRPRQYISGHNPQVATAQQEILHVLERGGLHRVRIAQLCNKSVGNISTVLGKLKKNRLVKQIGRGVWALIDHPGQYPPDNPIIECACGCGAQFRKFDRHGRPRHFVSGHNLHPKGEYQNGQN